MMQVFGLRSHVVKPNADLTKTIWQVLKNNKIRPRNGDILVVTSKIVSVCEGRVVPCKNRSEFLKLIRKESDIFLGGKVPLALKDHVFVAQAGIDRSNAEKGCAILWPKNSWKTAEEIRKKVCEKFGLKRLGVLITDSNCHPLRWGTIGIALGFAGFIGVEDVRRTKDIFGNRFMLTKKGTADQLASASVLVMGETDEKIPMAFVRNAPVIFTRKNQKPRELFIPIKQCLFAPIYNFHLFTRKKKVRNAGERTARARRPE